MTALAKFHRRNALRRAAVFVIASATVCAIGFVALIACAAGFAHPDFNSAAVCLRACTEARQLLNEPATTGFFALSVGVIWGGLLALIMLERD